ncbi:4-hydroxy-tetrahydrodipicolinate synthase [archaeon]
MFEGATTALITPFLDNGEVDYDGVRSNVQNQVKNGINGLLALGTTGETPTLSAEEQEKIIQITIEEKGGAFVMVGTGTNNTAKAIENTKHAAELGADVALVVTPYYNKPTPEGIYRHFKAVAESVDIPIMVYNIQGRTGKNIETPILKRLAQIDNIVAVKEASGNINQMGDVIDQVANKQDFTVLSGDDGMVLPILSLGGKGVVSVISNAIPDKVVEFVNYGLKGDFESARKMHYDVIVPMARIAFIETNPIPIKYICTKMGLAGGAYRMPMCEMQDSSKQTVDAALKELGLV